MKFAYLVIAHNNKYILYKLLELLDYRENDIYIHIDRKAKDFNEEEICGLCKKSHVYFVERTSVSWGGYSQINSELVLFKEATKRGYDYYHIISGVDLPLKTQAEIHDFFKKNNGKEFIGIFPDWTKRTEIKRRYSKYHFGQDKAGRNQRSIWTYVTKVNRKIQNYILFNLDRTKKQAMNFQGGPNWISVTDEFAKYIISQEEWIKKTFVYTMCCDEIFAQTLLFNSDFLTRRYIPTDSTNAFAACKRYIDWNRGEPYTWEIKDFDELMQSGYFFARKFGLANQSQKDIVDKIYLTIKKAQGDDAV